MKKSLLTAALAVFGSLGAFAQGYFYQKSTGTTSEYNCRTSDGATVVIEATSTAKTKFLSATQTMPFAWKFYGNAVTSYKVSTSGYLTFNTSMTTDNNNNVALPSASAPVSSIFAFWDSLKTVFAQGVNPTYPQGVRSWTYGTAPNRVHVVQWQLSQEDSVGAANLSNIAQFAIRFYEGGTGDKFDVVQNFGGGTFTGTIGVQNAAGDDGTQVAGSPNLNYGGATGGANPSQEIVYTFYHGAQHTYDVEMLSLDIEKFIPINQQTYIGYTFKNNGTQAITSFRVNYSVNGLMTFSQDVTGANVAGGVDGGTYSFAHSTPFSSSAAANVNIKVWVDNINGNSDLDHNDDTLSQNLLVLDNMVPRKALHEVFTSSTCPPCKPGNEQLQGILQQRMGQYTVIKYQYMFPGYGDPYFTLEGYARGNYYGGINSVPNMMIDGQWNDNPNIYTTGIFDAFKSQPAAMTMTGSQSIQGKTITITAKVKPVVALPGNYKIHFAVLERMTTKNIENNLETEFYWVMKKMIPDANGTTITFNSDAEQTITKSFTFPGEYRLPSSAVTNSGSYNGIDLATEHSVEGFNDLIGVVFVQDEDNKKVLQSTWSGNKEWDYYAGIEDAINNAVDGVTVYPNPAQNTVTINTANVKGSAVVKVVDITGKEVMTTNVAGGMETSVDVSALHSGVYFVHITAEGSTAVQKLNISK